MMNIGSPVIKQNFASYFDEINLKKSKCIGMCSLGIVIFLYTLFYYLCPQEAVLPSATPVSEVTARGRVTPQLLM